MASYTISIQADAWSDQADAILKNIERVDALLNQLADEAVLPILAAHYDASGIRKNTVFNGPQGFLKAAITKRGAVGNIITTSNRRLTVGVSYEQVYYARWVIEGRGPVRPKHAKMLHWIDPDTGKDIFAKQAGPAPPHPIYFLYDSELKYLEEHLSRLIMEQS